MAAKKQQRPSGRSRRRRGAGGGSVLAVVAAAAFAAASPAALRFAAAFVPATAPFSAVSVHRADAETKKFPSSPLTAALPPSVVGVDVGPRGKIRRSAAERSEEGTAAAAKEDGKVDGGDGDEVTYFSPNRAHNRAKFRYLQGDGDELDGDGDGQASTTEVDEDSDTAAPPDLAAATNEYSFFDEALVLVRAGSGGQGSSTHKMNNAGQNAAPDGGNGGKGGDVRLELDDSLNTLAGLTNAWRPNAFGGGGGAKGGKKGSRGGGGQTQLWRRSFRGENGQDGARRFSRGRGGKDAVVRVPPGTVVQEERDIMGIDTETGEEKVLRTELVELGIVTTENPKLLVAQGGEGGEGSSASSSKMAGRGVKRPRSPAEGGERRKLKLTLKIVADIALVGVPNAGKSTFLASVTRAKPKIANYPFTTVVPNLGVWIPPDDPYASVSSSGSNEEGAGSTGLVLCDVPGLIAGASSGAGLGHAFLRHVERCRVILHLVDATSDDPVGDFDVLNREIVRYGSGKLGRMPQIVVVNKIDAWDVEDDGGDDGEGGGGGGGVAEDWERGLRTRSTREELETKLRETMPHSRLMWMSAKSREGVDDLMGRMAAFVAKVREAEVERERTEQRGKKVAPRNVKKRPLPLVEKGETGGGERTASTKGSRWKTKG